MIDSHTHSRLSHDGKVKMKKMHAQAAGLGMEYYAITEHLDRDYKFGIREKYVRQLNLKKYFKKYTQLKEETKDNKMFFAFGVEAGYSEKACKIYEKEIAEYPFDVVINSIHTIDNRDAYFPSIFKERKQDEIYNRYYDLLIESLDVRYPYDIVGHIGYISRYAPYRNASLYQPQYFDKLDILLKKIIDLDKTIEINTHIRESHLKFLPETPILERYYELGGRNITFSSDAHRLHEIGSRYDLATNVVKSIGFSHWITYIKHKKQISEF